MELHLRQCTILDLDQLITISRETFTAAFEKDNDPDDFTSYINTAFSSERLASEIKNPSTWFYFVLNAKEIVGYFKLNKGDAQSDIKDNNALELERIYVVQPYQGKGIGNWILEQAKQLAKKQQVGHIWLGVWEKNQAAIRFYQNNGFKKFATHPYYIGKDKQIDWLMQSEF